jgi:hypothetical protein
MNTVISRARPLTSVLLIGCVLSFSRFPLAAQTLKPGSVKIAATGNAAAASHARTEKKPSAHPFHGKLAAVDKAAKTITVGKSVYHVTAETKIKKDGNPGTLADAVIGEEASGYVKPADDGTLNASSLNLGAKPDGKHVEKKKKTGSAAQ